MAIDTACAVLLTVLALGATQRSHAIELLRDINAMAGEPQFVSMASADLAQLTLFTWNDAVHGAELWATDGAPGSARLVLDIRPGPEGSGIRGLVSMNGIGYFWADDGTNGLELWRSDGTAAGTRIVANIAPDDRIVGGIFGPPLVPLNGVLYFSANDGISGEEIWRSNGTAAGTYRLMDVTPGAGSSAPRDLFVAGGRLYFHAEQGGIGHLWVSDGTQAGTARVTGITAGPDGVIGSQFVVSGNTIYFTATSLAHGHEVWRMAAGASTMSLVEDIAIGARSSVPRGLLPVAGGVVFAANLENSDPFYNLGSLGGEIYFAGPTGAPVLLHETHTGLPIPSGYFALPSRTIFTLDEQLWTTDGSPGGTRPLGDNLEIHRNGPGIVMPDGDLYFFGHANRPGEPSAGVPTQLWRSDGSPAGTQAVTDIPAGIVPGLELIALGERAYFVPSIVGHPAHLELWSSNGTAAGTQPVADIRPGPNGSGPAGLRPARGRLLFTANDGVHGIEPWISDGTAIGTRLLGDLTAATGVADSNPEARLVLVDQLLFTADDGVNGRELWITDGTATGTFLVRDIAAGAPSSNPDWFVDMGGFALFMADDGVAGRELWRTDGTEIGTFRVLDIAVGSAHGDPIVSSFGALVLNGVAYFSADDGIHGPELWRSDGTAQGTYLFLDIAPPNSFAHIKPAGVVAGLGMFAARHEGVMRIWTTDGTPAGTGVVSDAVEYHGEHVLYRGTLYFRGVEGNGETRLWRSGGTAATTARVTGIPAQGWSDPSHFTANEQVLAFNACTVESGCGMYVTNGADSDIRPVPGGFVLPGVSDGERIYYIDWSTPRGRFMVTDGTPGGTGPLVSDSIHADRQLAAYTWFAGSLVYVVDDAALGLSIWRVTASGDEVLVADIDPGNTSDRSPGGFHQVGTRLFVNAFHPWYGREPWVIAGELPNANDDHVETAFGAAVRIAVLANDSTFDGALDPGSIEIVEAPLLGNAIVDVASGEIVYTPDAGRSGADSLRYRVRSNQGSVSNTAVVWIIINMPAGQGPAPPPTLPPTQPPPGGNSGGGGGGAIGLEWLISLLAFAVLRRRFGRIARQPPFKRCLLPGNGGRYWD